MYRCSYQCRVLRKRKRKADDVATVSVSEAVECSKGAPESVHTGEVRHGSTRHESKTRSANVSPCHEQHEQMHHAASAGTLTSWSLLNLHCTLQEQENYVCNPQLCCGRLCRTQ
jgi:hypothetical protein